MMGAMYNMSLIGIVTMNPPLYNEYILIKFIKKLINRKLNKCYGLNVC
jgi:hypothetical protein